MNPEESNQLNMLSMFHYVVGGVLALLSCMPFIHVFMGLMIVSGTFFGESASGSPPTAFGWMFVIMGSIFILFGWSSAILILIAGKKLKARRNRMFCMVVAGVECVFMPFGTILGIFTLLLLNKESVKHAFASSQQIS